ncbi:hypothetical protein J7F01_19450 [Streptomyces sp. ISL-22]|uniref:hypothetical protein n=1 Tax=unclassified Streptomyces TaxID=2593676 RepID=UPI001BEC82CA|nr:MULTISPECIES: hypothetical protein [unclassified Streptomyces]MBT2418587.1 hypothetical protein [Streptomyces sp. ISL-24]MBT2434310.1 hypothetical protein [Streptomyces sp. ISL-22]
MVSSSHEGLHQLCQKDPAGFTRTLQRVLRIPIPEPREFAVLNADLTEIEPVERRVDTLLQAETDEGTYLLVVESQGKRDDDKRSSWAYYLSYLYVKYRWEPVLIVLTQSKSTARWAAQPIRLGLPGWHSLTVRPLVLGPENVPLIADEAEAKRDVFLAAFSAMTHGKGRGAAAILKPLAAALATTDTDSAGMLAQFVESCLVDAQARQIWKELMMPVNYFFRHEVAEKVREEGREEGIEQERVSMILRILDWRGIPVPDAVRDRVKACSDLDQLEVWAERAVHATIVEDLFVDD